MDEKEMDEMNRGGGKVRGPAAETGEPASGKRHGPAHGGHAHSHAHAEPLDHLNRAFLVGIVLNVAYVVVELAAGFFLNSVSLISDAGHNLSDVVSLVLALLAFKLARVKPNSKYTYGYKKSTVLVSLLNACILLVAVGVIVWESIGKLREPHPVEGGAIAWVAGVGIVINAFTAWLFMKDRKRDLNVKGAFLHMAADALVSLGVVVSGIVISATGWYVIDPIIGLVIAAVILVSTTHLLFDSLRLSLDGVPSGVVAPEELRRPVETLERLGKMLHTRGKKQEETTVISAGDIGAITKLPEAVTGDTLCDASRVVKLPAPVFPLPSLFMAVTVAKKGDEGKISSALARLMEEDPTLSYQNNAETHQQVIGGLGEQHLDVVKAKLKNKFGVEIGLEAPRIAYRESIRKACQKQGRHKKQTGGHGQFGDVIINFEPCDSEQVVFEEKVFGGSVPKNFFPAVEKGVRLAAEKGVLAGYPVVGLKATLLDGSYHPVDSSEMAFIMAAKLAYKAAMPEAGPVILEPIHTLKAHVPNDNTGDIMGDVTKRRGRVLGMEPDEDGLQTIIAEVPLAELANFTTFIRQTTQGRGWFTTEFARYEILPEMLVPAVVEQARKLGNLDESADD